VLKSVVKCSEGLTNGVSAIMRKLYIYISNEVCCLYGCFVHHVLSYHFASILYRCIYDCMFCVLVFNFVNYVFLL
jgi:hypothetical protein